MKSNTLETKYRIAVVGLGYVGLPLALAFGKKYQVVGYDINPKRVEDLIQGFDSNNEHDTVAITEISNLTFSSKPDAIAECNVFIVTVPTPLTTSNEPDLSFLESASILIGRLLKKDDIVVYESTVFPGCTEEYCVPLLEATSGMRYNQDFFCGYSPERINPGDKVHSVENTVKVTSGSNPEIALIIDELYASVIQAGTHLAPNIKTAEAAKAIENAQRDVNISFMNEMALIFNMMNIDTGDVLAAAATKWNFLPFKPGLVGGHCIGVDPHYLAYKASLLGYTPEVILSGRKVNEQMGFFVANQMIKAVIQRKGDIKGSRILILGFAFKANCADIRNTKVFDVYKRLTDAGAIVTVFDPWVDRATVYKVYGFFLAEQIIEQPDGIILTVAHDIFRGLDYMRFRANGAIIYDTQGVIDRDSVSIRL